MEMNWWVSSSWSSSSRADYIFSLFPAAFATREWMSEGGSGEGQFELEFEFENGIYFFIPRGTFATTHRRRKWMREEGSIGNRHPLLLRQIVDHTFRLPIHHPLSPQGQPITNA